MWRRGTWTPDKQVTGFLDAEEAVLRAEFGDWDLRAGVLSERWGVMTAEQITDVINQRDFVSDYRGRDRLGQPGVAMQYLAESWSLTVVGTLYSRARRLPRGADRFRYTGFGFAEPKFYGGQGSTPGIGVLLKGLLGDMEVELSHFSGHMREPRFEPVIWDGVPVALTPEYRKMHQSGLAGRFVLGDYVIRGAGMLRQERGGSAYGGLALGVERILYRVFGGVSDLLLYTEGYYDGRSLDAPVTLFDNDVAVGLRYIANDAHGTELSLQTIYDVETRANLLEFDARRRISDSFVIGFDLVAPINVDDDPALSGFEQDTRIRLSLTYGF